MHRQQNSLVITDGLTDTAHSVNVLIKPYFSWLINHHWWILCWLQARSTFLSMWIIPDLLVRAHFKHFLIMFPLRSKKTSALNASHEYKFCFIHKLHDSDIFFVFVFIRSLVFIVLRNKNHKHLHSVRSRMEANNQRATFQKAKSHYSLQL